ncbi:hypothetical protein, partial [Tautonia marina]|uniref:hypothetical protein n=1 Tax=Tautonia marina TaxID=2653855 RepID=UPI001260719B
MATLLFDSLHVAVDRVHASRAGGGGQPAAATKMLTIHVPYTTDHRSVPMTLDVRGFASADPGAHLRLVVAAGESTQVIDLTPEESGVELKGTAKQAAQDQFADACFGDFHDRVRLQFQRHAAEPVAQITVFLMAERNTDQADSGGAALFVDSLDLTI